MKYISENPRTKFSIPFSFLEDCTISVEISQAKIESPMKNRPPHSHWRRALPVYTLGSLVIGSGIVGFYQTKERGAKEALQLGGAALVGGPLLLSGLLIQLRSQTGYFLATSIAAGLSFYNSVRYASTGRPMPLVVMIFSGATGLYCSVMWYLYLRENALEAK